MICPDNTLIRLAASVELLTGPNDIPLVYVGERKSYLRLSEAGAALIRVLRERGVLTRQELLQLINETLPSPSGQAPHVVSQFLQQLNEAGVLELDGENAITSLSIASRIAQKITARPRLELPLWRPDRALLAATLQTIQARTGQWLGKGIGLLLFIGAIVITYEAIAPRSGQHISIRSALFILGILLLQTMGHEMSHALVSSYYGVKVREIGVALLYYFIPVAYTDRTDAYRLRDFRARANIALAGPVFDFCATALSAVIASTTSGPVSATFQTLMWVQLAGFISNLNPLMPGDACHILEAWRGMLNFRGRAFTLFWRRLTFRSLPPHLQRLTTREQWFHFGYAALASLYVITLAVSAFHFVALRMPPPQ